MLLQFFFIIGGVVTLAGFGFAIFVFVRDRRRRKLLTADVTGPFSLVSLLPDTAARKITLYYEEHDQPRSKSTPHIFITLGSRTWAKNRSATKTSLTRTLSDLRCGVAESSIARSLMFTGA